MHGLNVVSKVKGKKEIVFSNETMIGAFANYISTENDRFQPMNANFGILPSLDIKIKDKSKRYQMLSERALKYFD